MKQQQQQNIKTATDRILPKIHTQPNTTPAHYRNSNKSQQPKRDHHPCIHNKTLLGSIKTQKYFSNTLDTSFNDPCLNSINAQFRIEQKTNMISLRHEVKTIAKPKSISINKAKILRWMKVNNQPFRFMKYR